MTINELKVLKINETITSTEQDEVYDIPLNISDIIQICREYNQLGWHIQQQIENILEVGIEESIKTGYVKREALPLIKNFLRQVSNNPYFGDAVDQAHNCILVIQKYESDHGIVYISTDN